MSLFRNPKPRMSPAWWVAIALGVFSPLALATLPIQHWVQPSGARIYFVESLAIRSSMSRLILMLGPDAIPRASRRWRTSLRT